MSRENVEVVRACLRAFEEEGIGGAQRYWHPEIDWRAIEGAPDDIGVFHGREALRRYYADWYETFDDLRAELEETIDGGDQVITVQRVTGRARSSGVETELRYAVVYTVRDGKIVRGREYKTRDEALAAAGLRESGS
jgi:ketosteroid isomerase-like protein